MNKHTTTITRLVIYRSDVIHAIEKDPLATYRAYRGGEADDLAKLPKHCIPGLVRYVLLGIKPGSFLCAVLADEFELAKIKADDINGPALPAYRDFLDFACPGICWGSPEAVRAWVEGGGLIGGLDQ